MAQCGCPTGYISYTQPDGSVICRQEVTYPAPGIQQGCTQMIGVLIGPVSTPASGPTFYERLDYCRYGARFYADVSTLPLPVTAFTTYTPGSQSFKDATSAIVPVVSTTTNSLWGTGSSGPFDGRFNAVGIWSSFLVPGSNPLFGFYGFTFCLTVATTTTYCFGVGGKQFQLLIDGAKIFENTTSDKWGYENWHVIPVTLAPGTYILQLSGSETPVGAAGLPFGTGGTVGFAWEIYKATASQLAAMTTTAQLSAVTVYSTFNENGKNFDYGEACFNHRCPPGEALDNCTTANEDTYVCHRYTTIGFAPCCYVLTDCTDPSITFTTSTDLSAYLNQVITIVEQPGCFSITVVDCGPVVPPTVTVVAAFVDCPTCLPKCYLLTDCQTGNSFVTDDDFSGEVGQVVTIAEQAGCFTVSLAQGCVNPQPATLVTLYFDCISCNPPCYLLTDCTGNSAPIITNSNLAAYVGQVIKINDCSDTCWMVEHATTCTGAVPVTVVSAHTNCYTCLPIVVQPTLVLKNRRVKPGYNTPGCPPEFTEHVNCQYAEQIYSVVKKKRYGISGCCEEDVIKWTIKKQLLELNALYDPDACCPPKCCAPTCPEAKIIIFSGMACIAPEGVEVEIVYYPDPCPDPTGTPGAVILFNNPTGQP